MPQFEFFQNSNIQELKADVNGWLWEQAAGGKKIDINTWDFNQTAGVYTLTIFCSEAPVVENIGFTPLKFNSL